MPNNLFSFTFHGLNSLLDFGLMAELKPVIPKAQRDVEYFTIPGRSGSLMVDYETYQDILIPVTCWFKDPTIPNQSDKIKAWLDNGEGPLTFSNQTDKYYIAHVSDQFDISQEIDNFGKFQVNFRCQPFKYATNNETITLESAGIVYNPGTIESQPIITVYGTGDIALTINSKTIQLTNVADYVTVDSVLVDCYKDTALKNNDMTGDFPVLIPGTNSISWTGTVTKIEITPNWRWL